MNNEKIEFLLTLLWIAVLGTVVLIWLVLMVSVGAILGINELDVVSLVIMFALLLCTIAFISLAYIKTYEVVNIQSKRERRK